RPAPVRRVRPLQLAVVRTSRLLAPLQDAAAAPAGAQGILLAGGLTAADTSSDAITVLTGARARPLGRLPGALHDAAAVASGGAVYLFGGGNGIAQLDGVLRIDRTGHVAAAGR